VITHPFHPLKGQSLVVLFKQRGRHGLFFVCEVDGRLRITVAQDWTDRGVPASSDRLAIEGLSATRALIDKIDPVLAVTDSHELAPLNDAGLRTGKNLKFTPRHVAAVRGIYQIFTPRTVAVQDGEISVKEAAQQLGIAAGAIYTWLRLVRQPKFVM
jgi:Family of unknown function (DUF5372)